MGLRIVLEDEGVTIDEDALSGRCNWWGPFPVGDNQLALTTGRITGRVRCGHDGGVNATLGYNRILDALSVTPSGANGSVHINARVCQVTVLVIKQGNFLGIKILFFIRENINLDGQWKQAII